MPEFGAKMSPLRRLLRKTSKWEWVTAQEEAFARAKGWLSSRPVLIYSDYSFPFKLTTEASKGGLRAFYHRIKTAAASPSPAHLKCTAQ